MNNIGLHEKSFPYSFKEIRFMRDMKRLQKLIDKADKNELWKLVTGWDKKLNKKIAAVAQENWNDK